MCDEGKCKVRFLLPAVKAEIPLTAEIMLWIRNDLYSYYLSVIPHCKSNSVYIFLFWELRGLSPNFYIHVSVSDLYIPRIGPHISSSRTAVQSWEYIIHSQTHECGNWDWGPDIPFLGILSSNFRHFFFAVQIPIQAGWAWLKLGKVKKITWKSNRGLSPDLDPDPVGFSGSTSHQPKKFRIWFLNTCVKDAGVRGRRYIVNLWSSLVLRFASNIGRVLYSSLSPTAIFLENKIKDNYRHY